MANAIPECVYCGKRRHPAERCPRVVAIDYDNNFVDGPRIKRVEFVRPERQSTSAENIRAFFGDPDRFWRR